MLFCCCIAKSKAERRGGGGHQLLNASFNEAYLIRMSTWAQSDLARETLFVQQKKKVCNRRDQSQDREARLHAMSIIISVSVSGSFTSDPQHVANLITDCLKVPCINVTDWLQAPFSGVSTNV